MKKLFTLLFLLAFVVPLVAKPATKPQYISCFQIGYGVQNTYDNGAFKKTYLGADIYVNRTYYTLNASYTDNQFGFTGKDYFGETAFNPACSLVNSPQRCRPVFDTPSNSDTACGTATMSTFTGHGNDRTWNSYNQGTCDFVCGTVYPEVSITLEHLCPWP